MFRAACITLEGVSNVLQVESVGDPLTSAHATLVRVRGEVDIASADAFRSVLSAARDSGAEGLIVSLEDCSYFDSSGLAVLVAMHRAIGDRLRVILPPNTSIYRIFEITGLHRALHVVSSVAEAFDRWSNQDQRIAI